jgi:hypothetical protein
MSKLYWLVDDSNQRVESDVKLCEHSHDQYLCIVKLFRVLGLVGMLMSTFLSKSLELNVFFKVNCVEEHLQKIDNMKGNIECFSWQTSTKSWFFSLTERSKGFRVPPPT